MKRGVGCCYFEQRYGRWKAYIQPDGKYTQLGRFKTKQEAEAAIEAAIQSHGLSSTPCTGHPCDDCLTCRRGKCCKRDRPDYQFPALGEWNGPIYGQLGVMVEVGKTIECHACGRPYVNLANHALATHNLTVHEYRAIFGLTLRHALWATERRERQSESAKLSGAGQRGKIYFVRNHNGGRTGWTSEQLSELRKIQNARPELILARKTRLRSHCKKGHALTGANVELRNNGRARGCATCRRTYMRLYRRRWRQRRLENVSSCQETS